MNRQLHPFFVTFAMAMAAIAAPSVLMAQGPGGGQPRQGLIQPGMMYPTPFSMYPMSPSMFAGSAIPLNSTPPTAPITVPIQGMGPRGPYSYYLGLSNTGGYLTPVPILPNWSNGYQSGYSTYGVPPGPVPQHSSHRHHDGYIGVDSGNQVITTDAPVMLVGYYYDGYCQNATGQDVYPSVYADYNGFPQNIYNPGVIVLQQPAVSQYAAPAVDSTPQPTDNDDATSQGSDQQQPASADDRSPSSSNSQSAFPDGTYQSAFSDIERAWTTGDVDLISKHLRDADVKVNVLIDRKYAYSIPSDDYVQITRDAFNRLSTESFKFTRLREAANGDVTAYGTHVYLSSSSSNDDEKTDSGAGTVPFSTDGSVPTDDTPNHAEAFGATKTMYVSYTLRKQSNLWYIVAVDSSAINLVVDTGPGTAL